MGNLYRRQVEPKTDGSEYVWQKVTQAKRRLLGENDLNDLQPWTTREGCRCPGLTPQLTQPNFLHELLDIFFMKSMKAANLTFDADAPLRLFVDVRQATNYQIASGTVSMLPGSRIYHYHSERRPVGQEHFRLNGWGDDC